MRSTHLVLIAFALALPVAGAAQSSNAADTTLPAAKKGGGLFGKKGGLFGKAKALTQNKLVQTVAKTAVCNMVPGGQLVAGALDKGSAAKDGKDAAAGAAAGAALGAATGKGNPCGNMGLMGNLGASGMNQGVPGAGLPGLPTTGAVGAGLSAGQIKQMEEQYRKLGMNPTQIKAMQQQMQAATPGAPGMALSEEQLKQLQAQYQAMGMNPVQIKAMQQQMQAATPGAPGMALSEEQLKQMQEQYRAMGVDPAQIKAMQQMMTGATPGALEQPIAGAPPALAQPAAPAITKEKNRLVLRQLPWVPGTEEIQSGAESALVLGLHNLAVEIIPTGKHYTVQAKVEDQGSKAKNQQLAQKRAAVIVAVLVGEGVPQDRLSPADGGSDKDPRVIVSEGKATK